MTTEAVFVSGIDIHQSVEVDVEALLRQLTGESWTEQAQAIQVLRREGAPIVEILTRYLQHEDVMVRQGAVKALLQMRWIPGFRDTSLGYWLERSVVDILKELLRSDPSLLYAFLHDKDQRFREKVETIAWLKETPPRCFTAVYTAGEDACYQSFDIEGQDGSYLGGCGMVISDVAAGDPSRVIALEVWLFDKSDLHIFTIVLMSDGAYGNQSLRDKLGSRGEPVCVQLGQRLYLETRSLEMEIKVVELEYSNDGEQPSWNCFSRLATDLTIFERRTTDVSAYERPVPQLESYRPLLLQGPVEWASDEESVPPTPVLQPRLLLSEYTATFVLGDSAYDECFTIETPDGQYAGECGMTISEVPFGEPNRVGAIEVWLFDKTDIRTVTLVLMSDFVFNDPALREKLAGRGDALLAKLGRTFVLDTPCLQIAGKIVNLEFSESVAAASQFFQRLTVNMQVRRKES